MPELGQNWSPRALLPHGLDGRPCHGVALSAPWPRASVGGGRTVGGCSVCSGFGALQAWLHHYRWQLLTPGTGLNFNGERRLLGLHPINPFPEANSSFPSCPRCPWGGDVPAAGPCYCGRAPLELQCSLARPRSTAQEFPSRLGLGRPVCFPHNPKAQQRSTQIFIGLVENKIKKKY